MVVKHDMRNTAGSQHARYFVAMLLITVTMLAIPAMLDLRGQVAQAISLENAFRNVESGNVLHIPFTMWQASYDLYRVNSDGTGLTPLTSTPECECYPAWSPDGSKIAFSRRKGGHFVISVMDPDGSNVKDLFEPDLKLSIDNVECAPAWSPDGKHIAFTSSRDGNPEIYVISADGSNLRNLTNHPAVDAFPDWSPDGSEIAFASSRDGNAEIYVTNLDGDYMENVSNSAGFDEIGPKWMRNGETLVCMPTWRRMGELPLVDRRQRILKIQRIDGEQPTGPVCPLDEDEVAMSDGRHVFAFSVASGQTRSIMNPEPSQLSAPVNTFMPMAAYGEKILLQISVPQGREVPRFSWLFLCADGQLISPWEHAAVSDNTLIIFPQGDEFALVHCGPKWKGTYAFVRADGAIDLLTPLEKEISSTAAPLCWPYFDDQGRLAMPPPSVVMARAAPEQAASALPPDDAIGWAFLLADGSMLGPGYYMEQADPVLWILRDGHGLKLLRQSGGNNYNIYAKVNGDRRIEPASPDTPIALWWPYVNEEGLLMGMVGDQILDAQSTSTVQITIRKDGLVTIPDFEYAGTTGIIKNK